MSDMVVILAIVEHEVRTSHKAIVPKEKLSLVYNAAVCLGAILVPAPLTAVGKALNRRRSASAQRKIVLPECGTICHTDTPAVRTG
jgi:hypothetical protein